VLHYNNNLNTDYKNNNDKINNNNKPRAPEYPLFPVAYSGARPNNQPAVEIKNNIEYLF
jgi:hypothetical protein